MLGEKAAVKPILKLAQNSINALLRPFGLGIHRVAEPSPARPRPPIPEIVRRVQDEIAERCPNENYASHYRHFEYGFWSSLLPFLRALHQVKGPQKVLDIGCGYGTLLGLLSGWGWEVHGTDLLPITVLLGRETADFYGIRFKRSNIEKQDLPYEAGEFDVVVMTEILEHFHFQPTAPLGRALRVLRPGGHLLLATPALGHGWSAEEYSEPFESIPEYNDSVPIEAERHMKIYSPEELERLLKSFGGDVFVDVHINQFSLRGHCVAIFQKLEAP